MGLKDAVEFIEEYARSYIRYMLAYFGELGPQAEALVGDDANVAAAAHNDGSLLIFGLFNAVIGAALQGLFIQRLAFNDINFAQIVIVQVCFWLLLAIILDFLLSTRRRNAAFSDSLTAILKVAPVAYVIGAYAAFVFYFLALLGFELPCKASWFANLAFGIVQVSLVGAFLPRAAREIPDVDRGRSSVGAWVVILLVGGIQALVSLVTCPFLHATARLSTCPV